MRRHTIAAVLIALSICLPASEAFAQRRGFWPLGGVPGVAHDPTLDLTLTIGGVTTFGVDHTTGEIYTIGHVKQIGTIKTGLTNAASNDFVRIVVPQGTHVGGSIAYRIHADDGSAFQCRSGTLVFAAINPTGTEVGDVQVAAASEAVAVSIGSVTASFGITSNVADTMDIDVTPISSLTPTTLEIHYTVHIDTDGAITDL